MRRWWLVALLLASLAAPAQTKPAEKTPAPPPPVRFRITLDPALGKALVSGRLLLFTARGGGHGDVLEPSIWRPYRVWIEGMEVRDLAPGTTIEVAPTQAFPHPFSEARAGTRQFMALLDPDHSYTYYQRLSPDDLYSEVETVRGWSAASGAVIDLKLTRRGPAPDLKDTETMKFVDFESPTLTKFWGRPITMHALVLLPPGYAKGGARYPTAYHIHGYGGRYYMAAEAGAPASDNAPAFEEAMQDGSMPEMIHVFLDGYCPLGHHEFADSVSDGPWGTALVTEFIPYLEGRFRMDGVPSGRLVTGHSSGGWSSLWLQIHYPDFFGGTWSTSPDPPDFRSFTGIDLRAEPPENFYRTPDGEARNLVRRHGRQIMTLEQFVAQEEVEGSYGGQFESFDAVFSPRGPDGRPMPAFDRASGEADPEVAREWVQNWDVDEYLKKNWATLCPRLQGKLHVWVGTADNFHLESGVRLLQKTLEEQGGAGAKFTYLSGRDHMDLYDDGLTEEIAREMYGVARAGK